MLLRKLTILTLLVYILLTLYTLVSMFVGIPYHPILTPTLTLLAFSFAVLHGSQILGWQKALLLLLLTFAVSLLFESIGVATGWVYGAYHYTGKLGLKFLGLVPWLIPVAWFMMTYPSFWIASHLVPAVKSTWVWRLSVAAVGGLVMTAWDLAMDPMMVAGGHWVWDQPGEYFGVPLQNFWGWWLTIFVTFCLYLIVGNVRPQSISPADGFSSLVIAAYATTGVSTIIAAFEFGLDGVALVGIFAMLPWAVKGWLDRR